MAVCWLTYISGSPPYEALLEVASGMLLEASSKRRTLKRATCGNG